MIWIGALMKENKEMRTFKCGNSIRRIVASQLKFPNFKLSTNWHQIFFRWGQQILSSKLFYSWAWHPILPEWMNESIPIIHFCWARRHGESRRQKEQRATRSRFKQPTLHKCVVYHYFHLFVLFITTFTTLHVPCPLQKLTPSHTNAELK